MVTTAKRSLRSERASSRHCDHQSGPLSLLQRKVSQVLKASESGSEVASLPVHHQRNQRKAGHLLTALKFILQGMQGHTIILPIVG